MAQSNNWSGNKTKPAPSKYMYILENHSADANGLVINSHGIHIATRLPPGNKSGLPVDNHGIEDRVIDETGQILDLVTAEVLADFELTDYGEWMSRATRIYRGHQDERDLFEEGRRHAFGQRPEPYNTFGVAEIVTDIEDCLHAFARRLGPEKTFKDNKVKFLDHDTIKKLLSENLFPDGRNKGINHGFLVPTFFPQWPFDKTPKYGVSVMQPITGRVDDQGLQYQVLYQILFDLIHWLRRLSVEGKDIDGVEFSIRSRREHRSLDPVAWIQEDLEELGKRVVRGIDFNNEVYLNIRTIYHQPGEATVAAGDSDGDDDSSDDSGDVESLSDHGGSGPKDAPAPKADKVKEAGNGSGSDKAGRSNNGPAKGGKAVHSKNTKTTKEALDPAEQAPGIGPSATPLNASEISLVIQARGKRISEMLVVELRAYRKHKIGTWTEDQNSKYYHRLALLNHRRAKKGKALLPIMNTKLSNCHPNGRMGNTDMRRALEAFANLTKEETRAMVGPALVKRLIGEMKAQGHPIPPGKPVDPEIDSDDNASDVGGSGPASPKSSANVPAAAEDTEDDTATQTETVSQPTGTDSAGPRKRSRQDEVTNHADEPPSKRTRNRSRSLSATLVSETQPQQDVPGGSAAKADSSATAERGKQEENVHNEGQEGKDDEDEDAEEIGEEDEVVSEED